MPLSSNINNYSIEAEVLTRALQSGQSQVTYRLPTVGAATQFMMRAYKYRMLLQKQLMVAAGRGAQPSTPWDKMKLRREKASRDVIIDFAPVPLGQFLDASGAVVETKFIPQLLTTVPAAEPGAKSFNDEFSATLAALVEKEGLDEA
jgi:hypothetical protein